MEEEVIWLKVFGSPPILDIILKYLNFEDIKRLRSVSNYLNNEVVVSKRFVNNAVFRVTKRRSDTNSVSSTTLLASKTNWKNLKLDLYTTVKFSEAAIEKILDICHNNLEYLHIGGKSTFIMYENLTVGHSMTFCKLKNLEIDVKALADFKLYLFPALGKQLKRLRLIDPNPNFPNFGSPIEKDALKKIAETFTNLSELSINFTNLCYWIPDLRKDILLILQANAKTLAAIDVSFVWDFDEMATMIFPNLKSVNIDGASSDLTVSQFCINHPHLESVKYFGPLGICSMLDTMKGRYASLKRLILEGFWELEEHLDNEWCFLRDAELLEYISLRFYFNSIQLNKNHFWTYLPSSLKSIHTNSINREAQDTPTISSLSTFPFLQLTELNLQDGINPLEDIDFQHICAKLTKLQNLQFGNCSNLTDFGVTGVCKEVNTEISIKDLKGLEILSITNCDQLTSNVLGFIVFKFLRKFTLDNKRLKLTSRITKELKTQNPCLEHLLPGKD